MTHDTLTGLQLYFRTLLVKLSKQLLLKVLQDLQVNHVKFGAVCDQREIIPHLTKIHQEVTTLYGSKDFHKQKAVFSTLYFLVIKY